MISGDLKCVEKDTVGLGFESWLEYQMSSSEQDVHWPFLSMAGLRGGIQLLAVAALLTG